MALRQAWRRVPRPARIGLWSLAAIVGLVIIGGGIFLATFDPDSLKPRIIAAVKQQTGRDLTLQGGIHLQLSLQPTLTVQGVSFANPPGFSRPQMATLERLDLTLALLPLLSHQVEIDRLVLVKPDILLETDAKGQPNWQFTKPGQAPPQPAASGEGGKTATRITVADVRIQDGTVALRDGATGRTTTLGVKSLEASAPSPDANLHVAGDASFNGAPFTLAADIGPLSRLQEPKADSAWPVQLTMAAAGAKLTVDGTLKDPTQGKGYALKVAATVPDLAALSVFAPGQKLPPLHDVAVTAQIADAGAPLPQISGLTLHVGASDLTTMMAGLKLDKLDVSAAQLDQPVQVAGQGSFANTPATLSGTVGAPASLLSGGGAAKPIPLDFNLQAAGSSVSVKGQVLSGAGGRPSVQAEVKSDMIDADQLRALVAKAPGGPAGSTGSPAAAPAGSPAAPASPRPASTGRVIPDTPIPFGLLRPADADLALAIATLKAGGAQYRSIALHLVLHDGKLRLDPFSAELPEGHLDGSLTVDAAQAEPPVAVKLRASSLALQPLLAAIGEPAYATGSLEIYADLRGAGTTPHAIASNLDGSLGLALVNGTVDNRLFGSTLGSVLREVSLLDLVGRGGTSQVQCFASRLDASHGVGTFRTLVLNSSLLTMDGGGSVNLGNETLDLRVQPQARVGGTGVVVPLKVTGTFHSPSAAPDPTAAVFANAGTVAGIASGATQLGMVAGALTGQKLPGGGEAAECGPALAIARGSAAGPAPTPAAAQAAPSSSSQQQKPQQKPPSPGNLLRQLFR
jgi:uncharacterized protein involved in outer membrane biogenesis